MLEGTSADVAAARDDETDSGSVQTIVNVGLPELFSYGPTALRKTGCQLSGKSLYTPRSGRC
ncbi:hypothetical protein C8039_08360 [Halogeometricum sp. wsp3]|nr:hypothetical protein C8039_08360 [Halogeometricum sp. wsp3]